MNELASRYAEALFALAKENDTVKEKKEEVESLLTVLEDNPDLTGFFRAIKVTASEKKAFIDQVFGPIFDQDMIHFLKLLIDKGRIYSLREMLLAYIEKANEDLGIQVATVYSARKLKEEDMKRIQDALEIKTKKHIQLRNQLDESLIAGIKVVVGNNITDVSMKHKLEEMKQSLLKGGRLI